MNSRVTLRDIASAANVHYSTVSLALRDHPRVSLSVRREIKKLAESMGYTPDPALSALNAYRKTKLPVHYQSTLAWIDNWALSDFKMRDLPTFNEYFLGASARARQLGYEVEEFRLKELGIAPQQLSKILLHRGINGLLLGPLEHAGARLAFDYDNFSSISFGYSLRPHVFHLVTNHQFHSMTIALERIRELGYRRIGLFLHEFIDTKTDNAYITGYWRDRHMHPEAETVEPCYLTYSPSDEELFVNWFKKAKPDAIICDSDQDIVKWLNGIGLRVPEDVGCAWVCLNREDTVRSGVDQNGCLIGQTAIDFLIGMLQRGERGIPTTPIRMLVEGIWRPGKTLRPQSKPTKRKSAKKKKLQ